MDESRSIEFVLSFSDKMKCIQQFKHVLLMNFKSLEKCDILKMRKKSTLIKISSVLVFFEVGWTSLLPPALKYDKHNTLNHFFPQKVDFCIFTQKAVD